MRDDVARRRPHPSVECSIAPVGCRRHDWRSPAREVEAQPSPSPLRTQRPI